MERTPIQIDFGWADTTLNLHIESGASDAEIDALVVNIHEAAARYRADHNPSQVVNGSDLLDWLREELAWDYGEDDVGEIHERIGRPVPQPCLL